MITIGLVGGVASGKSTVAAELEALGAVVLDADNAAHLALESPDVKHTLVERWGDDILDASGKIDRSAVARLVFPAAGAENSELTFLESQIHPRIRRQFEGELSRIRTAEAPAVVIDAPLLLEAGWDNLCESVVFVDTPSAVRMAHSASRNWSAEEFARREAAQMSIEEKRRRSTHVIPNHGSKDDLRRAVRAYWDSLGLPN